MAENFGIAEGIRSLKSSTPNQNKNTLTNSVVDRFLKIEEESRLKNENKSEKQAPSKKKGVGKRSEIYPMLSFRCSHEMKEKLNRMDGKGLGKKIIDIISRKELYEETLKDQVAPLKTLASNFGQITGNPLNISEAERAKILLIADQFKTISRLIRYSDSIHGQFLTQEEKERIDKIIRLSRLVSP